jgi:hypothetical protein
MNTTGSSIFLDQPVQVKTSDIYACGATQKFSNLFIYTAKFITVKK